MQLFLKHIIGITLKISKSFWTLVYLGPKQHDREFSESETSHRLRGASTRNTPISVGGKSTWQILVCFKPQSIVVLLFVTCNYPCVNSSSLPSYCELHGKMNGWPRGRPPPTNTPFELHTLAPLPRWMTYKIHLPRRPTRCLLHPASPCWHLSANPPPNTLLVCGIAIPPSLVDLKSRKDYSSFEKPKLELGFDHEWERGRSIWVKSGVFLLDLKFLGPGP